VTPYRSEDEARAAPAFCPHAVRDGTLITGQQRSSGRSAAEAVSEPLGR
jgi:hypothetical protein